MLTAEASLKNHNYSEMDFTNLDCISVQDLTSFATSVVQMNIESNMVNKYNYKNWTYYTRIAHIETCTCNATREITEPHVIRSEDMNKRYVNCLGCNHLLDMNYDVAISSINFARYVTQNGSYISSIGIIVLVDLDIQSYFNGTLEFIDTYKQ